MKVSVQVKPNSKKEAVEKTDTGYLIRVNAPPTEGQANERVIELLAKHLSLPKSQVEIKSGHKGKNKILVVPDGTVLTD